MNLLLDANISHWLTAKLQLHFETCFHVDNIGITVPAKDMEIWKHALDNDLIK